MINEAEKAKHEHTQIQYAPGRKIDGFDKFLHVLLREVVRTALNKRLPVQMFIAKGPFPKDKTKERELGAASLFSLIKGNPTYKYIVRRCDDAKEITWFNAVVDFVRPPPFTP